MALKGSIILITNSKYLNLIQALNLLQERAHSSKLLNAYTTRSSPTGFIFTWIMKRQQPEIVFNALEVAFVHGQTRVDVAVDREPRADEILAAFRSFLLFALLLLLALPAFPDLLALPFPLRRLPLGLGRRRLLSLLRRSGLPFLGRRRFPLSRRFSFRRLSTFLRCPFPGR